MVHLQPNASSNAVYCNGGNGYPIDTSTAGPSGTGGNLAIVGGPATNQFCGGNYIMNNTTQAQWKSPVAVVPDPYSSVPAPTQPAGKVLEAVTPVATVAQGYTPNVRPNLWLYIRHLGCERNGQLPQYSRSATLLDLQQHLSLQRRKYLRKLPGIYSRVLPKRYRYHQSRRLRQRRGHFHARRLLPEWKPECRISHDPPQCVGRNPAGHVRRHVLFPQRGARYLPAVREQPAALSPRFLLIT